MHGSAGRGLRAALDEEGVASNSDTAVHRKVAWGSSRAPQRNPERSVRVIQRWAGVLLFERCHLLRQSHVFNQNASRLAPDTSHGRKQTRNTRSWSVAAECGSLRHIFTPEIRSSAGAPAVRKSLIPNVDSY